jgi:hypothetical protein
VNGMVMDFGDVKAIAKQQVVDVWDHAFLAYRGDTAVVAFLQSMPGHKTVILDVVPTAENLAAEAFRILDPPTATSTATTCASSGCACSKRPTAGPTPARRVRWAAPDGRPLHSGWTIRTARLPTPSTPASMRSPATTGPTPSGVP